MSTRARCWAWRRLAPATAAISLFVVALGAQSAHAEAPPAALPQLWGVEVDGKTIRSLDRPLLERLKAARMVLVAGDTNAADRAELRRLAERWSLQTFEPIAVASSAAASAACVEFRRSNPGSRCGVRPLSASADDEGFAQADLVVVSASGKRAFARLAGRSSARRVAGTLDLSSGEFRARKWRAVIAAAKRSERLDLIVRPHGPNWRSALVRYVRQLGRQAPGGRSAPARPQRLRVTGTTGTSVSIAWRSSGRKEIAGYGLYRNGGRSAASSGGAARFDELGCSRHLLEVDAFDAAGGRSAKSVLTAGRPGATWTLRR